MSAQRRTVTRRQSSSASGRSGAATVSRSAPAAPPAAADRSARASERAKQTPPRSSFEARFDGVKRVYRDTSAEMKKINWPDRETTKNLTLVVVGISTALGLLLGGVDLLLRTLFEALP